jgi:hypothetical protein
VTHLPRHYKAGYQKPNSFGKAMSKMMLFIFLGGTQWSKNYWWRRKAELPAGQQVGNWLLGVAACLSWWL